ncbi:MAG TPA: hypothetical protein VGF91_16960 [Solirubrobacteraceae bacterium]|jgi:hypothetical protein
MVTNPYIAKLLIEAHTDDLRRAAGGRPPERPANDELHRQAPRGWLPIRPRLAARRVRSLEPVRNPCP